MTEENPVTDEMVSVFLETLDTVAIGFVMRQQDSRERLRQAIHAAIKAGRFVSREQLRDEMAERVAAAAEAAGTGPR